MNKYCIVSLLFLLVLATQSFNASHVDRCYKSGQGSKFKCISSVPHSVQVLNSRLNQHCIQIDNHSHKPGLFDKNPEKVTIEIKNVGGLRVYTINPEHRTFLRQITVVDGKIIHSQMISKRIIGDKIQRFSCSHYNAVDYLKQANINL